MGRMKSASWTTVEYDILWTCLTTIFACIWVSTMVVALIAPEIIVGFKFAARQWLAARRFSKHEVSLAHGFFYSMGGFVDAEGYVILDDEEQLTPAILSAIKAVPTAEIQDKSKRDGLAKLLAVTQILRIVAQSLARWNQHLAITSLEIATVAYAFVAVLMWFFWMNKPLDTHIVIQLEVGDKTSIGNHDSADSDGQRDSFVETDTTPSWGTGNRFTGMLVGNYDDYNTHKRANIPVFFSLADTGAKGIAIIIECSVAIAFGAIHCIAWNTMFPSTAEKWMWRASAVAVTGVPVMLPVPGALLVLFPDLQDRFNLWIGSAVASSFALYIIARLFLLPAVFIDISWVKYIPHL
ncbi:hypothetical protein R3P38DRAFT_3482065 [Favolaschia claudopus]|uniref:PIN-like protein n=1 Tax=Favolaschia claudopus TaxID=2862362 RepID=A0AAV9Z814_9AGAR